MKLTEMLISAIVKKGILYEARNVDTTFTMPIRVHDDTGSPLDVLKQVTVNFKAEHMSLRVEKENEK